MIDLALFAQCADCTNPPCAQYYADADGDGFVGTGPDKNKLKKALKDYRSGERSNEDPSKIMAAIAYKLDDTEIEALSSFVHGLY